MATYRVNYTSGAFLSIAVEADNEEDAIDKAYEEVPSGVCAQCSGWGEKWSLDVGDDWELLPSEEGSPNPALESGGED